MMMSAFFDAAMTFGVPAYRGGGGERADLF